MKRLRKSVLTLAPVLLLTLLTLPFVGCAGLMQRLAEPPEPAKKLLMTDIKATVLHVTDQIPKDAGVAGSMVIVESGGIEKPLLCMIEVERECEKFRRGETITLNRVYLRPFTDPLVFGGVTYTDYWVATGDSSVRWSMR